MTLLLNATSVIYGQKYNAYIGLALHDELAKAAQKNTEKINTIGYMASRQSFSFAQGTAFTFGFQNQSDSSNITLKMGFQHLFGNTIQAASNIDSASSSYELWQSNQTNLQLGVGFRTKGKHSVELVAGPLIPIYYKTLNTLIYNGDNESFDANYKVRFKNGIGIHLSTNYIFKVNEKINFMIGGAFQVLNRKIDKRDLAEINYKRGQDNSNFAKTTYQRKQVFVKEIDAKTNDVNLNPKNFDANKPREILTQSYSFGSLAIQFGLLYLW